MRRAMLMISGIGTGVGLFALFCVSIFYQCIPARAEETPPTTIQAISLPCPVEDTALVAVGLARYEGPFWEDGSDDEVADVAALVIENTGGTHVAQGAVILDWGSDRLVFELSALPPGQRVLVLEKDRKAYLQTDFLSCYGWTRGVYPENMGIVTLEDMGGSSMAVTNHTQGEIAAVRILYKNFDSGSGMYIGGVSYTTLVTDLRPGEVRQITPYRYFCGYSRVITLFTEYTGET